MNSAHHLRLFFNVAYQMLPRHFAYAHHADCVRWRGQVVLVAVFWLVIHKIAWARGWAITCLRRH